METEKEFFSNIPKDTKVTKKDFSHILGWNEDNHEELFRVFVNHCDSIVKEQPVLRNGLSSPESLKKICKKAIASNISSKNDSRIFFENNFIPFEIIPPSGKGFLTSYYEPEISASLTKTAEFPIPAITKPKDFNSPLPDRAEIWNGALDNKNLEIAWLEDYTSLFITQVQGSARLRLTDGNKAKLVYGGKNGQPYTSIGKLLVDAGDMKIEEINLKTLKEWLREDVDRGRKLMEKNKSYVFFNREDVITFDKGPIGGAGIPLTKGRSLAIDRNIWPYGIPIFIESFPKDSSENETSFPKDSSGYRKKIARTLIAQDTGSAIIGAARGDYFMGSGEEMGEKAGLIRDPMRFFCFNSQFLKI